MAEQRAQDVVNQSLSVGDLSPSDAPATTSTPDIKVSGDDISRDSVVVETEVAPKENGIHTVSSLKMEELEDGSARSDTDTSRAEGSVAGDKPTEPKPLKKFAAKPVSFAKYSVPKVIAASAATKANEKTPTPHSSTSSLAQAGRPRLVAKTTSSLQSKTKPYQSASPDPMQVWNKNRVTPQPSTKHLTDEELKQQYGIHLTSRIQADSEGKEAKWADIDDDEDDWAPETIEWNDGTKSTLTHADVAPQTSQKPEMPSEPGDQLKPVNASKAPAPQFASSVGPNATVLKLGASAERQLAQRAATLQAKTPAEKPSIITKATPAPTPSKSPWAQLPPVDKISPVAINPLPIPPSSRFPPSHAYAQSPSSVKAPSPAKEISADDFNRSWRDSLPGQQRELYVPGSGRYEAVAEPRRRMSRNDQGFRAPAVLQRPIQTDAHAPAEPSPAFQTHRTSTDQARRRASSTISGGSGQFGRRMSIKSGELPMPIVDTQRHDTESAMRPISRDGPLSATQTPTYQARGTGDYVSVGATSATDADIEAQRAQQRALMKENIERARKRKIEEEERLEAEKQERIRLKLASLGPDPKLAKKSEEAAKDKENDAKKDNEQSPSSAHPTATTVSTTTTTTHSPPKPPQPLASGEPQQYGMMKVHPLDSVKKMANSMPRGSESQRLPVREKVESSTADQAKQETLQVPSPIVNGVRPVPDVRRTSGQEPASVSEPSPKLPKPSSVAGDARSGWGDVRHDHRAPQTGNLWGLPNNKALGNGTFDQSLAGYSPQDLSRTSSTAAGWMNGRTPHSGRSPQIQHVNHILADNRSYSYQSVTSPDQGPLAVDSEADSLFPTTKPAPIGPPQLQQVHPGMNGMPHGQRPNGVDAWNNFHALASQQERTENEKVQREMAARREEELRTGVRQGPAYTFNETWKQVQVGDQAQRSISSVSQSSVPASSVFGAVGSLPGTEIGPRMMNGPPGRGSRFFPQPIGPQHPLHDRRAVTYSHPEPPRTPSPPPAEEYASLHPAFDGDFTRPVVHFPQKPVVKLPPAMPPTPPSPVHVLPDTSPATPLTWAARVSMPPPPPPATLRSVSTPIVQNPSWQERFNGLLGKKSSPAREAAQPVGTALAVASSTREPLDVQHVLVPAASVSLPVEAGPTTLPGDASATTKDVESEDDLFEDRELGSLPTIKFPLETPMLPMPPFFPSRTGAPSPEVTSVAPFMVNNWFERHRSTGPQFALIKFPGLSKAIKKELPMRGSSAPHHGGRQRFGSGPPSSSGSFGSKGYRNRGGPRSRQASKAH
ncbi:hypothetical protein, variant [Cladophialophora immunda]|uniref:Uncharacterized protein n=1 Tax=Cladophialophora immunda TaxID=569365 RepID=A0A0D2CVX8_9EURO|nr:uncharacterized protein PV07_00791 [Cladophialophora immunda]XP_016254201.1 hypothetical protein, variant [Cladophialophora immunda]KIW33984.1 hypothetical protein PV07_00791 [Cladophialophora immunda]KIW33985.1 hypothetical protein, variant [Cladophialophora immunda]OQU94567.1 hypothetical protein CLAIMM_00910 isoform 1 [Cladophialophora immunda]OQU94568.1 hypothetical protein CLAIMM_00910 isoform 2 [Cladophialophora immunda]